jgi:hypothetical protein
MTWDGCIRDMPKLQSPFIRKEINGKYVVTPEIEPGYEWVLKGEEQEVLATEKLDGTNVSIVIENGKISRIFNRTAEIPFFNKGKSFIIFGILESFDRGYCNFGEGQYFGELIGKKLAKNPYNVEGHIWIPFNTYCREHLSYKSWHKYPKTFENISEWFRKPIEEGGIFSLYMKKRGIDKKPEGIVFHNLKTGQLAKLRMDMWDWYEGRQHKD